MEGHNAHAHRRRKARCQRRTKQPHIQWENKHIVQHHIGETAADHTDHGKPWSAVVSHKGQHHIIGNEEHPKKEHHPQVIRCHGQDVPFRSQKGCKGCCQKNPHEQINSGEKPACEHGFCEYLMCLFFLSLRLGNGIPHSAAHGHHKPCGID